MKSIIATVFLFILYVTSAFGGTTGKISGKVADAQSKEPPIGVNIVIVGTTLGTTSDLNGDYFIINIPPGTYEVKASAIGYAPQIVSNVSVSADRTTQIDFTLAQQGVEMKTVEVVAVRPLVQKDLTSTTSTVTSGQIASLPIEDVSSAVNLQAGVVDGHFRGGRSNEVKYLIDGMSVNDVFSGGSELEAEINSVQEIQVLSGTFNAEYGEALSGVVNEVTKTAHENYAGSFSAYTGDYVSSRTGLFQNIDHISPSDLQNYEGLLSGPLPGTGKFMKFVLSGRYYYNDGYLYGKRVFNPSDSSNFSANDPSQWYIGSTGDGKYVPMNYQKRYNLQGKVSFDVGNSKGLILQGIYQDNQYRDYDQQFQLDPDGDYTQYQKSFIGMASFNDVLSNSSFIDFNASAFVSDYKEYVYENPLDPRYVNPQRLMDAGANAFLTGGTENWHFYHQTNTYTDKIDFTSQVTNVHEIKTGIEGELHRLNYQDYQIHVDASSGFKPALPAPGSFDYNTYDNTPYQLAAYIQDKIELPYLVVNVGLRFDYFEPDGEGLKNPNDIAEIDQLQSPFPDSLVTKASAKYQLSPRIGISYPITDQGAVHISYGHFFQIPAFEYLYKNPNFRIPLTGNYPDFIGSTIGNADLQPQRTTMYEVGLQQELAPNLGITVTGYYKDIRNLLGLQLFLKNNFVKFGEYVNVDYGAVQGFTISIDRRLTDGFGANLDYTYQVAKGNTSDPEDDYNKATANPPIAINQELVPLNWDRRHSLNLTVTAGDPNDLLASFIVRLGSGLPYTPALQNQRTGLENSGNMPMFFNTDIYLTKYLNLFELPLSLFVKVYNVFDTANEINVFTDTGRAGYTLALTQAERAAIPVRGDNTLQQYYSRPDFYSAPRQVEIGMSLTF
ncbi:MAG TPA: TonB-dependent receptor [Bacteroidota bacterium]|nr:TonB-dependent receptor [Bacteroidota bacterium]